MGESMASTKGRNQAVARTKERIYKNEAYLKLDHTGLCMMLTSVSFPCKRKPLKGFKWVEDITKIVVFKRKIEVECNDRQMKHKIVIY